MKQARKVEDALEVQRELTDVRTEIEQLEGRRRFIDNQTALSTITISLQTPAPIVAATTTGFGHNIRSALGDGVDVGVSIIIGLIRMVIILIPIILFILLPLGLLLRFVTRRFHWPRRSPAVAEGLNLK